MLPLANPEAGWARREDLDQVSVAEVERCLGRSVAEPLHLLSGGRANTNIRVEDRVVRIHRRDPSVASLEARLLTRGWRSFRVPRVLAEGEGFLVLEHVAHGRVLGCAHHGTAVGRALAEVHAVTFDAFGELASSGTSVREPFPELIGALVGHARSELETKAVGLEPVLRERLLRALEACAPALREVAGPPVLLHGDFKASNLHWAEDDRLLVLDWEFAYAGAALSDIGQLLRWHPPPPFVEAFADAYRAGGGVLVERWETWAAAFDLVNLAGLLVRLAPPDVGTSARVVDLRDRIETTLAMLR